MSDANPGNPQPPGDYHFWINGRAPETYHPETLEVPAEHRAQKFIEIEGVVLGGKPDDQH